MLQNRYRAPSHMNAQRSSERGFTMVEMLVTAAVGTIAIITVVNLFTVISASQRNVWYEDVATRAARSEIENARAKGVASLVVGTTVISDRLPSTMPAGTEGTLTVGAVYAGQARLVTVTITWQGGKKKVVLSGTVGQQGLLP
jgi:prepilin-type N-terminal cleavage/methylation domain-containing protein